MVVEKTEPFRCIGVKIEPKDELFVRMGYIATNLSDKTPYEIFKLYAQRATEEQAISQLKDELAFGYVPSMHEEINEAFAVLNIVAYNVYVLMKYIMETKGNEYLRKLAKQNPKLKTFKFLLFDIAAKFTTSSRKLKAWVSVTDKDWYNTLLSWWNSCFGFGFFYCRT